MEVIIKLSNVGIHFSETFHLSYKKTNLSNSKFTFKESTTLFCNAQITGWNKENGELKIIIIGPESSANFKFSSQQPKKSIKSIVIEKMHWPSFEACLSTYQKHSFDHISMDQSEKEEEPAEKNIIRLAFKVNLKDVRFYNGFATISKNFKWSEDKVEVRIDQSNLLQEFNYIKPYFAAHWKKKTIQVSAIFTFLDKKLLSAKGVSTELNKIDQSLIDVIKKKQISNHLDQPFIKILDKSLFTMDDLFNEESDADKGNLSTMDFNELFNLYLGDNDVRNAAQLKYLAGSVHQVDQKIRITLSPNFGFVFHHSGALMSHYIWELLNSNATYIWSFDHSVALLDQVERLENIITGINLQGRQLYRISSKEGAHVHFNSINHANAHSSLKQHFPKWRLKVDELLV